MEPPPDAARPRRRWDVLAWFLAAVVLAALAFWADRRVGLPSVIQGVTPASFEATAAVAIFVGVYVVMALGKLPGYRLDRAGAALLGASLMVGAGVLSPEEAFHAVDFDTIALLLGMMIVVANLRVSGFFRLVNTWVVARARHPFGLLVGVVLVAGFGSAFLVNDTICLVMTPLVLDLVLRLERDPIPYLLGLAMGSNIGSVATITGNPQNMIVGILSGIPYGAFAATLAPVAAAGLVMTILLITLVFRREFLTREGLPRKVEASRHHRPLVLKSIAVTAAMIVLFFLGRPVAQVAILGGGLLLVTRRVKPEKIYREIDWPLLIMFSGLFIVVGAMEKTVVTPDVIALVSRLHLGDVTILSAVTALLSNIVSNVPAVLVLKPFVANLSDPQRAWLVVAMASTLAGNLTLVGSVANLIVAQRARACGVTVSFLTYFKVGAPLTLLTIVFGVFWLGGR